MNQPQNQPVNITTQIVLLYGGLKNLLNDVALTDINLFERKLHVILNTDFFSDLLKNTIKIKLFDNVMEYLIYGLKITLISKKI